MVRQTPAELGDGHMAASVGSEPSAAALVGDLRSTSHREPVNPKANYRTRDVQLFEDAAACIERLERALAQISRMRTFPDDKTNTFTLVMAHKVANRALGRDAVKPAESEGAHGW